MNASTRRLVWALGGLLIAACSLACDSGESPSSSSSSGSGSMELPAACVYANPFAAELCGAALRTLCNSFTNERECSAQEPFSFNDGDYVFACGWAKVITFSDAESCTVGAVAGRCEAGFIAGPPCGDPCDGQPPDLYTGFVAIERESELVEMPCGLGGSALSGPVGEWISLEYQREREVPIHPCGADLPPPPRLCECAQAACEARDASTSEP